MPALRQAPPPAQPWIRETPPPAPYLTTSNRCSQCGVQPMPALDGMKVCPVCYELLRHPDYGAAERQRKAELNAMHAAAERERREARRLEHERIAAERRELRKQLNEEAHQRALLDSARRAADEPKEQSSE